MTRLVRSAVLDASVEQLWPVLRDFGSWGTWHAAVASCRIEGPATDAVGALRKLELNDGTRLREQLIGMSDRDKICTWCLVEATTPCDPYVLTLRIRPVLCDGRCFLELSARFEASHASRAATMRFIGDTLMDAGLAGLSRRFGARPGAAPFPLPRTNATPGLLQSSLATVVRDRPKPATAGTQRGGAIPNGPIETGVILIERHGGPEVLTPARRTVPPPGVGEVRVRHAAIGVNMIDVHGRAGEFGLGSLPAVPGMEAAGTVIDIGHGVDHLGPGDRVVYAGRPPGAYAELRTLPADIAVPLPPDVDESVAAASFLKGITADLLLHDVHPLRAGELVLVHAAAGGLGLLLCAWARALGATVIGVVSHDRKVDIAAANCAAVIVASREDVATTTRELTRGRGVDVVFDGIGRDTFEGSLAALASRGHLVSFGQVSGPVGTRDIDALATRSIRLSRPNFADYTRSREALADRAERLFGVLRSRQVRPVIDSEWPLSQAADAHRRLESRESTGSILLLPDPLGA